MIREIRHKIADALLWLTVKVLPEPVVVGCVTNLPDDSTPEEMHMVSEQMMTVARSGRQQIRRRISKGRMDV